MKKRLLSVFTPSRISQTYHGIDDLGKLSAASGDSRFLSPILLVQHDRELHDGLRSTSWARFAARHPKYPCFRTKSIPTLGPAKRSRAWINNLVALWPSTAATCEQRLGTKRCREQWRIGRNGGKVGGRY